MNHLCCLVNSMFTSYSPERRKMVVVVILPKSSQPTTHYKIAEAAIINSLKAALDPREILPKFRFGFRKGQSTAQLILRVAE
jgi:hypothetical protein